MKYACLFEFENVSKIFVNYLFVHEDRRKRRYALQ